MRLTDFRLNIKLIDLLNVISDNAYLQISVYDDITKTDTYISDVVRCHNLRNTCEEFADYTVILISVDDDYLLRISVSKI